MTTEPVPQAPDTSQPRTTQPETTPRRSFITPEMIAKNPILAAAGAFAGDPLWAEVREEIKRNRERDRLEEEQAEK